MTVHFIRRRVLQINGSVCRGLLRDPVQKNVNTAGYGRNCRIVRVMQVVVGAAFFSRESGAEAAKAVRASERGKRSSAIPRRRYRIPLLIMKN